MTLGNSWHALIRTAAERGLPLEELLRPGVSPAKLDKAEKKLGIQFHPDVRELYQLADGVQRGSAHGYEPSLLGFSFPGLRGAVRQTIDLRDVAESLEGPELWQHSWLKVFDDVDDENFAVDCRDGSVWYAYWEADEIYQVAPDLATFFVMAAQSAQRVNLHYELEGDYFATPDGNVWGAPIKIPWKPA